MFIRQSGSYAARKVLRTTRAAFTLLEVLVVVAIIVMLAGVGGYYLLQRLEEAKVNKAKMDVRGLASQLQQYNLKSGEWPASIEMLAQPWGTDAPMVRPDALLDPWGQTYQYQPPDGATTFEPIVFTVTPRGVQVSSADIAR